MPSHVYVSFYLFEWLCCLHLVGVWQYVQSHHNDRRVDGVMTHEYLTKDPSSIVGTR
jgi:hypothetical protein